MSESVTTRRSSGYRSGMTRAALTRAVLVVGAVALVAGTLVARSDPATGYEVSIYAATPALFWAGVIVAFGCSLGVALLAGSASFRRIGLLLGGLAMLAVLGLPLVRGYAFYGTADPLSHLGWVRDLANGQLWLPELLYPGLHGTARLTQSVTSASLYRTMMLVPLVYLLLFVVGVPLAVWSIVDDWTAIVVGAFAGFMLLPVNNISAYMSAHPSTLAILFTPFIVAVLVAYLREPARGSFRFTATGAVLALSSLAIVLVHPQQAANLLLVLGTIGTVQVVRRRRGRVDLRRVYGQTGLLAVALVGWSLGHQRVIEALTTIVTALVDPTGTHTVVQRSGSLFAIGASPVEIVLKLFLVSAVFAVFAGIVMYASLTGRLEDDHGGSVVAALSLGLAPVGVLFLVYLAAGNNTMFFRHFGFIMALVTIIGAVGLLYVWRSFSAAAGSGTTWRGPGRRSSLAVVGVVGVLLLLSVVTLYPSPYMYQPTSHVTEAALEGHGAAFDYAEEGVEFYGIRDGPDRFRDGLTGTGELDSTGYRYATGVTSETLDDGLTTTFDEPVYLVTSQYDLGRETVAFRSLRYSEEQLTSVGDERGVHRVMSNGDVELFLVG